jgi:hypothetical protein
MECRRRGAARAADQLVADIPGQAEPGTYVDVREAGYLAGWPRMALCERGQVDVVVDQQRRPSDEFPRARADRVGYRHGDRAEGAGRATRTDLNHTGRRQLGLQPW